MTRLPFALALLLLAAAPVGANPPAVDFENLLEMYFDDESGLIAFGDYTLGFASDAPFDGLVAVLDEAGNIVGQHGFYPDYVNKVGVFARIRAKRPADITLNQPGLYTIVFVADGQPVTRFPVRLELSSDGSDPFDPQKTYRFDGYWRTLAHLTMTTFKGEMLPEVTMWLGGIDLPEGARQDSFVATLYRNAIPVAHSKQDLGIIRPGHFQRTKAILYHPHDRRQAPNAKPFLLADWQQDGQYELQVSRSSDGLKIRSFDFQVADAEIVRLERSKLGHEPATDYLMPRVLKRGATGLEMTEAIWIQDHP